MERWDPGRYRVSSGRRRWRVHRSSGRRRSRPSKTPRCDIGRIHIGSGPPLHFFTGPRAWDFARNRPLADDQPAGLLAWLLGRWNAWSDNGGDVESVFTKDDLLTHATICWANNSIATSMRYYANANRHPWPPAHNRTPVVQAPVGLTFVTHENPPGIHTADERVRSFNTGPGPTGSTTSTSTPTSAAPLHPPGEPRRLG